MPANRSNPIPGSTTLIVTVIVVAVLHFARDVFIPLALAVLFSFLLAPLVTRLRHWGMWRVPAVLTVVVLAFAVLAVSGGLVVSQLVDLGHKLPEYENNVRTKLHSVRDSSSGVIGHVTRVFQDFSEELKTPPGVQQTNAPQKPVPVEIRRTASSPLEVLRMFLGSVVNVLLVFALVVVFAIFMLLQHEDLRDRLIRLVGSRSLNVTTKAFDEAGDRVSRYLVAQLIVNVAFGIPAGVALYFLGVPNPMLWAVLAVLLRYVPYLGIWIAAAMPAAIVFAVDPGWAKALSVFGIYFGIDLIMYNFVEPFVYGNTTGLTPLAILVSAVFWTWLWGAVGLLLATPLTVCLAVLGRYVPSLQFLGILLGDEPVLSPDKRMYQRILAGDLEEATELAGEYLKGKTLLELYDTVVLPALHLAEVDRHAGHLDEKQQASVFQNARLLVETIGEHSDEMIAGHNGPKNRTREQNPQHPETASPGSSVLSLPARDEADEIVALMLAQLLNARGVATKSVSSFPLASEQMAETEREHAQVACICAVPPDGYLYARYLCKRLRSQFPDIQIVAAILDQSDPQDVNKRQPVLPADEVTCTLEQTVAKIISLTATQREPAPQPALSS